MIDKYGTVKSGFCRLEMPACTKCSAEPEASEGGY